MPLKLPDNPTIEQVKAVALAIVRTTYSNADEITEPQAVDGGGWKAIFRDDDRLFAATVRGGTIDYAPTTKAAANADFAEPTKRVLGWNGLKIGITHEIGDTRHGTEMRSPYGRLYRSYGKGMDGNAIDFYVVNESGSLFKIRQLAEDGTVDEIKYAIALSLQEARDAYLAHVPRDRFGGIELADPDELSAYSYEEEEDAIALNERELELDWAAEFAEVGVDFAEDPKLPDPTTLSPDKLKQMQTAVVKRILQEGDRGYKGRIDEIVFEDGNPMRGFFSDRRTRPVKVLRYEITTTSKSFSPVSGFDLEGEGDR